MALRHKIVTNGETVQALTGKVTNCGTVTSAAGYRKVQAACQGICDTGGPRQHHSSSCGWVDE